MSPSLPADLPSLRRVRYWQSSSLTLGLISRCGALFIALTRSACRSFHTDSRGEVIHILRQPAHMLA